MARPHSTLSSALTIFAIEAVVSDYQKCDWRVRVSFGTPKSKATLCGIDAGGFAVRLWTKYVSRVRQRTGNDVSSHG